jgi:DNA-binding response OmpR family regulator
MWTSIVDDDRTFCEFLAELLQNKGHEVDWTIDGLEGYKMSQRKHYDLCIFDVRMPFLLGTELAEGLRQQSSGLKIILISAFADDALCNTAKSLGVPLLSKPFTTEKFLDLVAHTAGAPQKSSHT